MLDSLHARFPDSSLHAPGLRAAIHELEDERAILQDAVKQDDPAARSAEPEAAGPRAAIAEKLEALRERAGNIEGQIHLEETALGGDPIERSVEPQPIWAMKREGALKSIYAEIDSLERQLANLPAETAKPDAPIREAAAPLNPPAPAPVKASEWTDGVAGFATGMVQFEDERDVFDALDIRAYATRFARVIALRDTELPLSIGLFGEWGSGKTYFMKLLRQEIRLLETSRDARWCKSVVPVRFNAWHYLDTNLWASLVTEIFDQLFDFLAGPERDSEERLKAAKKVMTQIERGKGAVAEMKAELKRVRSETAEAKREIRTVKRKSSEAAKRRAALEAGMAGALDKLRSLFPPEERTEAWKSALSELGLDPAVASIEMLQKRTAELTSLGGRVGALWNAMLEKKGRTQRFAYLFGALVAAPSLAAAAAYGLTYWTPEIRQSGVVVGQWLGLVGGAAAWLGPQLAKGHALVAEAETLEA
ncbi:MAG TPA: P-loop NTPase fold protein, partial [Chthoniobacteraceae bacterium]